MVTRSLLASYLVLSPPPLAPATDCSTESGRLRTEPQNTDSEQSVSILRRLQGYVCGEPPWGSPAPAQQAGVMYFEVKSASSQVPLPVIFPLIQASVPLSIDQAQRPPLECPMVVPQCGFFEEDVDRARWGGSWLQRTNTHWHCPLSVLGTGHEVFHTDPGLFLSRCVSRLTLL